MRREAHAADPGRIQRPPQRALDAVLKMNQSHADACDDFSLRSGTTVPFRGDADRTLQTRGTRTRIPRASFEDAEDLSVLALVILGPGMLKVYTMFHGVIHALLGIGGGQPAGFVHISFSTL